MDEKFLSCIKATLTLNITGECISYLLSKGLSIGIIVMSCTLKLPQIISMLKTKSNEGLSYISIYSDIITFLFGFLYSFHNGYAFSTYGENVIILIQNIFILLICWKNDTAQSSDRNNFMFFGITCSIAYICLKDTLLNDYAWYLIGSSSIPLTGISRISQIISSYKEGSTGPLSSFTFLMNILGNLSRIFTSIKETGDKVIIFSYIFSALLNFIVLAQIIYYSRNKKKPTETENMKNKKVN